MAVGSQLWLWQWTRRGESPGRRPSWKERAVLLSPPWQTAVEVRYQPPDAVWGQGSLAATSAAVATGMWFVNVCIGVTVAGEIYRVSYADWAPFRRQPERGFSFCLWTNGVQSPSGLPGRLLPGFPFLYPGGRVQERVAHEVGEAFIAGFGGGDEAAFVAGGYADRDLSRFPVFGGFSDSWILCGFQVGRVTLV